VPQSAPRSSPTAPGPVAGPGVLVSQNWKRLLERKPLVAPKAAARKAAPTIDVASTLPENCVAMDCEMVGVGAGGSRSALARVSIVGHDGKVLLDAFVQPQEPVTDYRTHITGITRQTLEGKGVLTESVARRMAEELLEGRIVIGHALKNDFEVLLLSHPQNLTRDTAQFRPLRPTGFEKKTPSLKTLAEVWLRQNIQDGVHDSVQDARTALQLYRLKRRLWEKSLRKAPLGVARPGAARPAVARGEQAAAPRRAPTPSPERSEGPVTRKKKRPKV